MDKPFIKAIAYEQEWVWCSAGEENNGEMVLRAHWKSVSPCVVRIYPPSEDVQYWVVERPDGRQHEITGNDCLERCFVISQGMVKQFNP